MGETIMESAHHLSFSTRCLLERPYNLMFSFSYRCTYITLPSDVILSITASIIVENIAYTPNINLTKFEPLKPSHSGDISLLVFKISTAAAKQPCLDQKIQCLFLKYSYFLCIFWHIIFRAFSYIAKCSTIKLSHKNIVKRRKRSSYIFQSNKNLIRPQLVNTLVIVSRPHAKKKSKIAALKLIIFTIWHF